MEATGTQHEQMHTAPESVVGSCSVTNCTYNEQHRCTAKSIQVAFVDGMAHCATYTPGTGAMGMGSTEVSEHTSADIRDPQ